MQENPLHEEMNRFANRVGSPYFIVILDETTGRPRSYYRYADRKTIIKDVGWLSKDYKFVIRRFYENGGYYVFR